jgi:hypothetical protein
MGDKRKSAELPANANSSGSVDGSADPAESCIKDPTDLNIRTSLAAGNFYFLHSSPLVFDTCLVYCRCMLFNATGHCKSCEKKTGEGETSAENKSDAAAAFAENEKCTKNNAPKEKGQEASHTDSQERKMSTARNFANVKVLQRALFLLHLRSQILLLETKTNHILNAIDNMLRNTSMRLMI